MNYLRWHYFETPQFIFRLLGNYLFFVGHFFSADLLLKTLFSPWKRQTAKKEKPGWQLGDVLGAISFNLVSRTMGFIIRISLLIVSLLSFLAVILVFVSLFIFWFFIPVFSLPIYLKLKSKEDDKKKESFLISHLENSQDQKNKEVATIWYERVKAEKKKKSEFWTKENLSRITPVASTLSFGYTILLDKMTQDLGKEDFPLERFVGRDNEISQIENELSKPENNNVILAGTPGVGLKSIVIGLAKLIQAGKVPSALSLKKLLFLDTHNLTISNLKDVLEEAKGAGNIILVIPYFEELVKGQDDMDSILSEELEGKNIQLIGLTDPLSFQKYILKNAKLVKLFQKIDIDEVGKENLIVILENKAFDLEREYKISTTYEALLELIKVADSLISDVPFPQKAIDVLEEGVVSLKTQNKTILTSQDIDALFSQKTKVPVGNLNAQGKEKLRNLEALLHQKIIGQDFAVKEISEALKRKATGVSSKNSTIGSFLFLGPTGVGKTHSAKALAKVYFGSETKMIRLDMSEFQTDTDVAKLIGDSENPGILTSQVRENPYTVVLLDEFEKANQKILNLFLTVFDEGYLTDGGGKRVNFKESILIATSNAGSEFIREEIKKGTKPEDLEKKLIEYLLSQKVFSPELLNRFDAVIFYKPLSKEQIEDVAKLLLGELNDKLKADKDITIDINPQLISKLVEKGYDETFGARNMQRVIEEEIENKIAQKILEGDVQKGSSVEISL